MSRWLSVWVGFQEVVKHMQQRQDVRLVTIALSLPNIINNNVSDFFAAMVLRQKVLSKCGRGDFGKVLVLRNGEHFFFGQAT